jgi:hypothetical protein
MNKLKLITTHGTVVSDDLKFIMSLTQYHSRTGSFVKLLQFVYGDWLRVL